MGPCSQAHQPNKVRSSPCYMNMPITLLIHSWWPHHIETFSAFSSRKYTQRKRTYYKKRKQRNMQQSKFNNGRTIGAFLPLFSRCWIFNTQMYQNSISHFYLFHCHRVIPAFILWEICGVHWLPGAVYVRHRTVARRLFYNFLTTGLNKRTMSKLSSRWYGDFYDMLETSWVFDTHKIIDFRSISTRVIKARSLPKPMPTSCQSKQISLNSESICTNFIQRNWLENVVHALIC